MFVLNTAIEITDRYLGIAIFLTRKDIILICSKIFLTFNIMY